MKYYAVSLSLLLAVCFLGCKPAGPTAIDRNARNIDRLRNCIETYSDAHGNQGPKNKKQLLDYLTSDKGALLRLKRRGVAVEDLEDMFVSERDGEPFKIRWGLKGFYDHAIVFEAVGVDGKREIGLINTIEVDDDELYNDYWTGKIKPAFKGPPGGIEATAPEMEDMTTE